MGCLHLKSSEGILSRLDQCVLIGSLGLLKFEVNGLNRPQMAISMCLPSARLSVGLYLTPINEQLPNIFLGDFAVT